MVNKQIRRNGKWVQSNKDEKSGSFDIIIPVKDQVEYLERCVSSVLKHTRGDYTIVIVDDGSVKKETAEYLSEISRKNSIKIIRNQTSLGFSKAVNKGIKSACGKFVCLLNSDAEVGSAEWTKKISSVYERYPDTGVVGVLSNNANNQTITKTKDLPAGYDIESFSRLVSNHSKKLAPLFNLPTGFCYIFPRSLVSVVGYFDDIDFPHYGSEDDFSMRALAAGFKNRVADDVFVLHAAGMSYKNRESTIKETSVPAFHSKWGTNISSMAESDYKGLSYIRDKVSAAVNPSIYTVEIPSYEPKVSGGIRRHKNLAEYLYTVEIPWYRKYTGGLNDMLHITNGFSAAHLRIQRMNESVDYSKCEFNIPWSVGFPDKTFPSSKFVITYSDTTNLEDLLSLPQVGKVGIYMLSYGMVLERERFNALNDKVTVMTSTKRTADLIRWDGGKCHNVGFGLDLDEIWWEGGDSRHNYITVLAHNYVDKRYEQAMAIAARLVDEKLADGIVTFGLYSGKKKFRHHVRHHHCADRQTVRKIFNDSTCFIMPSITEGLNLTPMEATVCKCPAVLCDGAIGELYFDTYTCRVAVKDDVNDIYEKAKEILQNYNELSEKYYTNMMVHIKERTWDKVVTNIRNIMEE